MKKLISMLTALCMGCVFVVSAMASGTEGASFNMQVDMSHVYISDATIEVGDTYTWYYDGEAGPVDYGEQGTALRIVSGTTNDQGGMTFVYEGVEPGTHTFRIVDRWWTTTYKMVTVTVEAAASDVEDTPAEEPEISDGQPETPAGDSQTPAGEEQAPAGEDQTPADEDQTSAQQSAAPAAPSAPVCEHDELAEAIANGTWGQEYTTCPACGHHNWTAGTEGYVCDTCGHIVTRVKTSAGVKGYVGPTVPAPMTAAQAQAANDAYLAAIKVLQQQVAQREAAYLAALQG